MPVTSCTQQCHLLVKYLGLFTSAFENFFSIFVELESGKNFDPLVLAEIFAVVEINKAELDVISTVLVHKPLKRHAH